MFDDRSDIMQDADAETRSTAQALYNEFVRLKAKSVGKVLPKAHIMRNPEVWIRIAKVVQKLGASPEAYIEAQFALSRMEVFANSLHGETAQKRYKTYCKNLTLAALDTPDEEDDDDETFSSHENPDVTKLKSKLTNTYNSLRYYCGGMDLNVPDVEKRALEIPLHFDPVCMLLIHPVPLFKKVFGSRAIAELKKESYMRRAALSLGFDLAIEYIEEEDDDV